MYTFTKDCLTGIDSIDKEHEQLFKMINEAVKMLNDGHVSVPAVKNVVNHLKDYAAEHFAHEEAYMEKIGDPELARQKKEHASFAAKVTGVDFDSMTDDKAVKELTDLVNFLAKWLYHHILGSDIMIGKMPSVNNADQAEKAADNSNNEKSKDAKENQKKSMFEFTDDYRTDIDFVDDEHKKLFEIIERTYDVINNPFLADKYDSIVSIIAELKDYTELHFKDEEDYMEKIGYEGLAAQKLAHESFVERLTEIDMEEVDDSQHEYLCELIDFLLGWLKNHILKMDKKIPVK